MASLELVRLTKRFKNGTLAVADFNLEVRDGELLVIVGPSGCGKTTVLRLIAGLESPTSGGILLDGQDITRQPPARANVAMVFQDYALYPHLSVGGNLAFGLQMRKVPISEADERINRVATLMGLENLLDNQPGQLSGGQQQRVALARALVRQPRVFLLDEPLSQLDANLRDGMRDEIAEVCSQQPTTSVYVTHDQAEAMTLGERIAVMREGAVEQLGTPREIYACPANVFVANFVGWPSMNLLPGRASNGAFLVDGNAEKMACQAPDGASTLGIRAEDLLIGTSSPTVIRGEVERVDNLGPTAIVSLATRHGRLRARVHRPILPPSVIR